MADHKENKAMYKRVLDEHFPPNMEISFIDDPDPEQPEKRPKRQTLRLRKTTWQVPNKDGELEEKGLRYGENPGQEAAVYRLLNGNLILGDVQTIQLGTHLASNPELLQSGKHPSKTNITDPDNALNILRYFTDEPCVAIMKHNNPCGVALGSTITDAYLKADLADRIAAFGGTIALNREVDKPTAEAIIERYSEVVVAPEYAPGVMELFAKKKNLRVMRIGDMSRLQDYVAKPYIDLKSLMDGGVIAQMSYVPKLATDPDSWWVAEAERKGETYRIERQPTEAEYKDMRFGWLVESGVTSNSVIFVKDGVTVAIGTGEQDRVGVTKIAIWKAYEKYRDNLCFQETGKSYDELMDETLAAKFDLETQAQKAGLPGAVCVSDAFFPFPDGPTAAIQQGVTAIIQPGGSLNDHLTIEACNKADVTMVYTGQRSFKH